MHRLAAGAILTLGLTAYVTAAPPRVPKTPPQSGLITCRAAQGAVVPVAPNVLARLGPGAQIHVTPNGAGCALGQVSGRVFVRVASAPVAMDVGPLHIEATQGEFFVDVDPGGRTDLQIFNGDAKVTQTGPMQLAGKDRRARGIKRDKVTKRKENTKGLSRVKPKPVAKVPEPPPPPQLPPPPPPPQQAFVGPPAPEVAPVAEFLPAVAGAGILGTVGTVTGIVGGITGVVVASTSDPESNPPVVVAPASL